MDTKAVVKTLKRSAETIQTTNTPNKSSKIMHTPKLISERKFPLNKSKTKFISIGIDVENWVPMLLISGSNDISVPLSYEDWNILTSDDNINQIKNFFETGTLNPIENVSSGFKITGQLFNKSNIIQCKKNNYYICLAEITMMILIEIIPLINMHIREIEGLQINDFYTEILLGCIQIGGDAFFNFDSVAKSLTYHQGISLLCVTELLYMYPEIIKQNLYDLMKD